MTIIDNSEIIRQNRQEYSDSYESMNWLTPGQAVRASGLRQSLINTIFDKHAPGPGWLFSKTKLFTHAISPGCTLCGQGDWSCLFINGICNAKCFYCPTAQDKKGQPMTGSLEFANPGDYADYVRIFNIKGVSFSGGEPLMTFDRVLLYLKTLCSRVSHPLYVWMYTNGLLVTRDKLKALRDNGLDEIRFDISANHYSLDAIKMAVGIIPRVTVEIPAIPEDFDKTRQVIKELHCEGVNYLNLHQIRCTRFNQKRLIQRGYTFLHGPKVTILETELTALKLILYSLEQNIGLPVNYCSFTYRNQFQRAGAHTRNCLAIKAGHEDVTPTGYIRTMGIYGIAEKIGAVHNQLLSRGFDQGLWRVSKESDHILFNAQLWPWIDFSNLRLKVSYYGTSLKPNVSFRHLFKEVALNRKKKVVIERYIQQPGIWFDGEQIHQFGNWCVSPEFYPSSGVRGKLPKELSDKIRVFEFFNPGLAQYC